MTKITLKFLVWITFLTGCLAGYSQESGGLSFGVRLGPVLSSFNNTQPQTGVNYGFTVGGLVEYAFSDVFSVQAEPAYLQQGGTYIRFSDDRRFRDFDSFSSVYTTDNRVTLHSADLPIMAKYKFLAFDVVAVSVVLGPSVSYLFYANNSFERTYHFARTFTTIEGTENITSEYERFQVAGTGGLGLEFPANNNRIFVDLRYKYGITPVKKSYSYIDLFDVQGDLSVQSFYFTLGFGF